MTLGAGGSEPAWPFAGQQETRGGATPGPAAGAMNRLPQMRPFGRYRRSGQRLGPSAGRTTGYAPEPWSRSATIRRGSDAMSLVQSGLAQDEPTDADIASYREHGYWVSPVIVPDSVLDEAERGMARFYAGDVDRLLSVDRRSGVAGPVDNIIGAYSHWGWRSEHGNVMRKNDYVTLRVGELAQLAHYPAVAACAARLSGADGLRLWHDQLLYKPIRTDGERGNVGWHTDRHYWQTCSDEDMLTAWIPFADVAAGDGAMAMVDGSYRWSDGAGIEWQHTTFSVIDDVLATHRARLVPIELRRGQVSFHHCKTLHGSGPNRGAAPRRSLVVHFQATTNQYVERGRRHPNDDLVRRTDAGHPDYGDPAICPVLYP
jgi:hypothetical protein